MGDVSSDDAIFQRLQYELATTVADHVESVLRKQVGRDGGTTARLDGEPAYRQARLSNPPDLPPIRRSAWR
jgi:hypothetical protein